MHRLPRRLTRQFSLWRGRSVFAAAWLMASWPLANATAQGTLGIDIEKPPFEYSQTPDNNRVSRLVERLKSKEVTLEHTDAHGYLKSLLAALEISESSQALVFSKTSMQVRYISPRNPRAIYFNDDTYVGWVRGSSLVEISTADPKLGAAFYTVDMLPSRPLVRRAGYDCLGCHATSLTQGTPGHTVRSVLPEVDGRVRVQRPSLVTDDSSPFAKRWGGWYVTGQHGEMSHMGNATLRGDALDTVGNANLTDLSDHFQTKAYLSPHSDIVALMVLEHQTQMHNTLTRADFQARQLAYDHARLEATEESAAEHRVELQLLAAEVVRDMLFCDEFQLTSEVSGLAAFAEQFVARGPRDSQGRSLRDFDLRTRMFKYPCSYLIHSAAFDALTPDLRAQVISQLRDVLEGRDQSPDFAHLDPEDRRAILEILRETHAAFAS